MIVVYDTHGRITRLIDGQSLEFALAHNVPSEQFAVEVDRVAVDYIGEYVFDGEVAERPTSPVSRTDLTLANVPTGSKLFINGESYDAAGTVELEFPLPGTYRLRVECFPFLDWVDEVVV